MYRISGCLLSVLMLAVVLLPAAGAARGEDIDVDAVLNAIERGQKYLWSARIKADFNDKQRALAEWKKNPPDAETKAKIKLDPKDRGTVMVEGVWPPYGQYGTGHYYTIGQTCLAVYALIESGVSPVDERIRLALDWLARIPTHMTYELGLRANVWHIADRVTKQKYLGFLKRDVALLIRSTRDGSYNYFCYGKSRSSGDNSNSQYGLLGVWGGAQAGLPIPMQYWSTVEKRWKVRQGPDGGWSYRTSRFAFGTKASAKDGTGPQWADISSATMSAAGLASLFVCYDNLNLKDFIQCNRNVTIPSIQKGLAWFDKNFPATIAGRRINGYYLYGLERVGLASGYKYFGKIDWYKEGVKKVLASQGSNGSWAGSHGPIVNTSYTLLFLARGLNPVVFNKLQFHGDWNNRPRDLASLTRWMSAQFERTLNWQIINLDVPVAELHDAPFLYISGSVKPGLSDEEKRKLKRYILEGGTVVSVTECGGQEGFRKGIREIYEELFPDYKLKDVGRDHPVYSVHYKLYGNPKVYIMTNGIRPIVYHIDEDLSKDWQLQASRTRKGSFEIMGNIVLYHIGRFASLRPRGTSHWPEPLTQAELAGVKQTVPMAVVSLDLEREGLVEPLAYQRFATMLARRHSTRVEFLGEESDVGVPTMKLEKLGESGARVAVLIGSGKLSLDDAQKASIQKFIQAGGTILLDAQGGDRSFAMMAEPVFSQLFKGRVFERVKVDAEVYQMPGLEISEVAYRKPAQARLGNSKTPMLQTIQTDGPGRVYFSAQDISAGLAGYVCDLVDGYVPESSWMLMRNIVLQAAKNMPEGEKAPSAKTPTAPAKTPAEAPSQDDAADAPVLSPFLE